MKGMSKADHKMAIRQEARQKVRPRSTTFNDRKAHGDSIEKGLGNLRTVTAEAGDSGSKQAKNELVYLINNYQPRYDMRIEQLIDVWRRSGDPSYDPGIKIRFRNARRDHSKSSNAL